MSLDWTIKISVILEFASATPAPTAHIVWLTDIGFDRMFAAFHTPVSKWYALRIRWPFFEFGL